MARKRAAGEGTLVYDERRGLWVGRVPRSVNRARPAVYGQTQTEAREKLRRAVRDVERGLVALSENTRLAHYLEQWLDVVRSRVQAGGLAPSTGAGYERVTRRFLCPRLGRVPLRKLTSGQIEALFGELQAEGYAPATIRHVRATLSRALSDAMRDELLYRNVARLVEPPHLDRRHPSAFTVDEFRSIVVACGADRLGALFLITAHCGLRRSEALGLLWRDIDLASGTFAVRQGLHHVSKVSARVTGQTGLVASRPKTDASSDRLPLSRHAVELLREHRRMQAQERLKCPQSWPNEPADTHVFCSGIGTPLHPSNVARAWRRILERADVSHCTSDGRSRGMHELRGTFATRLRDRGVPLEDVQRLGRWASSKMLLELYSASDGDRLRAAAEAVGGAMSE
jgi:integrase